MLRDHIYDYYINKDYNCAESLLYAVRDEYKLKISDDAFKLIGGFGGGMGCGKTCGALCSGVAAIGMACITHRAHTTEKLKGYCILYVERFIEKLGNEDCEELVKKYKEENLRCLETVLLAADVLETVLLEVKNP